MGLTNSLSNKMSLRARLWVAFASLAGVEIALSLLLLIHMARHDGGPRVVPFAALLAVVAVLSASIFAGFKIIDLLTRPLSEIVSWLNRIDFESDLSKVPSLDLSKVPCGDSPELSSLEGGLNSFLEQVRGSYLGNLKKLVSEKRRADMIADSISDGILLLSGERIMYVNPIARRILDLPSEIPTDVEKDPPLVLSRIAHGVYGSGKGKAGAQAILATVSRTMPVELVLESEDRKLCYLLQSYPVMSAEGELHADTLVLAQDVTIVRESQEAKSHFLATLSHEVKTPVTSLTMATRLLKKSVDQFSNPIHRSLIQTCSDDVDRLRVLIEDLLSASKFDTLTQRVDLKSVDLAKLIKQSVRHFQPEAFDRGVEMRTRILVDSAPVFVSMDATKISWALSNLIVNALRHTPRGGTVEVILAPDKEHAQVIVRDSGPGIERNRQERIFDRFSQYYDLRVGRSGGAGLGLAIAKEIISAHGGRIWLSSEVGVGSDFCFVLPLKPKAAVTMHPVETSKGGSGSGSCVGS